MEKIKVAIAHEFLTQYGGAEKTLEAIAEVFPDAPIYTAKLNPDILPENMKNRTFICPNNNLLNKASKYLFTFLMAPVFESFDFSGYDMIISDGTTWNKGILTKPDQLHITYIHTPPRFLYKYSTESTKRNKWYFKLVFSYIDNLLRMWDYVAAQRPEYLIANSNEVKKRIFKFYRRESSVIYPPVETEYTTTNIPAQESYYIAVGRLIRYKNFDKLITAFNELKLPLYIIGTGSYEKELKKIAGPTIIFKGRVNDSEKHTLLENALGLINPVEDEDFGIVPVEAMVHGIPVLAHKSGGHIETIQEGVNGLFIYDLEIDSLKQAINEFNCAIQKGMFNKDKIKQYSQKFSKDRFKQEFSNFVTEKWEIFKKERA
jgi:glycosyltransferase involved in cell wall biosynthesis